MVAEHGEENPVGGGPGMATGGIDILVEATGEQPAPGGAPQAQVPVEPGGGMAAGPAAAAAPAAGAAPTLHVLGQQGLGSQAAFAQLDFGSTFGGQQQQRQQQQQQPQQQQQQQQHQQQQQQQQTQQQQEAPPAAARGQSRSSSEDPTERPNTRRVRSANRTKISSQQWGAASTTGNGVFSGSPPGNVGGGNVDYPQMQQMLIAMME